MQNSLQKKTQLLDEIHSEPPADLGGGGDLRTFFPQGFDNPADPKGPPFTI